MNICATSHEWQKTLKSLPHTRASVHCCEWYFAKQLESSSVRQASCDHRECDKLQVASHDVPVEELITLRANFCRNEIARQVTTEIA